MQQTHMVRDLHEQIVFTLIDNQIQMRAMNSDRGVERVENFTTTAAAQARFDELLIHAALSGFTYLGERY